VRSVQLIAASGLAALGLAGCNDNRGGGGVSGVCKPFTTANAQTAAPPAATTLPGAAPPANAPADPAATLDDCLHRWGYTLAASSDPANFVADATLAACGSQLASWNQQTLTSGAGGGAPNGGAVEAPSLMNGQNTNPLAEHYSFAQGRALFYVVQARAGKCAPPPAAQTNTAPNRS